MELKDLIGYQIIELYDSEMLVQKDSNTFTIEFDCDHGDCCGYSDITNTLFLNLENSKENPVITKVEFSGDEEYGSRKVLITFFGGYKPIAEIEANAGSGSGWMYGATVTAKCKPLNMDEEIVGW